MGHEAMTHDTSIYVTHLSHEPLTHGPLCCAEFSSLGALVFLVRPGVLVFYPSSPGILEVFFTAFESPPI